MKLALTLASVAIAGTTLAFTTPWAVQDADGHDHSAHGGRHEDADEQPDMAMTMARWLENSTPGEEHAGLAKMVGRWNAATTFFMAPGAPPSESQGSSEYRMLMDGRFLLQDYKGTTPMGPFQGMGITGFDKTTDTWTNVWFDTMGTGMMVSTGRHDPDSGHVEMHGTYNDPFTGDVVRTRALIEEVSDDEHRFRMYETKPGIDGEYLSLEIVYTRA